MRYYKYIITVDGVAYNEYTQEHKNIAILAKQYMEKYNTKHVIVKFMGIVR